MLLLIHHIDIAIYYDLRYSSIAISNYAGINMAIFFTLTLSTRYIIHAAEVYRVYVLEVLYSNT